MKRILYGAGGTAYNSGYKDFRPTLLEIFDEWTGERFYANKFVYSDPLSSFKRVGLQFKHFAGGFEEMRLESKKQNMFFKETVS